jgi:signal transduction histidine kinase/ActR/RegA family two-component response regulator
MESSGFNLVFPQEYLRAALMVSLLSVWMLVGLFYYLNHYTKRDYFTVWTAAWLFYALWLTLNLEIPDTGRIGVVFILKQWCVAISSVFLLWGSLRFLSIPVRQTLFGLFMLFLLVWTFASPQALANNELAIQLPIFILLGLGSVFAGVCFYRLRRKMPFVGAGMLSLGFMLWGGYLASYPFSLEYKDLSSAAFFVAAVLQLFIAVSMIVLVLEEARYNADRVLAEIAAVRSEKEALQVKVLSAEEQCRSLYDRVRLTEGLQEAYEELRRTQQVVVQQERLRALGQMASGIAHDINNALSPIVAYSELLQTTQPDLSEKAREYLQIINQAGEDIAHIVTRMREFYRRHSDSEPLTKVDLNQIVKEVIVLTRPRWRDVAQRYGISINVEPELESGLPPLLSDASELREALTNLIFNAVDALPSGGTINLVTRSVNRPASPESKAAERQLQIEVRDDGVGMDEKTRLRCLEPFFSTKAQRGGTGLGLAMVYGMMQRHDGTIDIESLPGKGTSIRLTFPMRESPSQTAASVAPNGIPKRSLNILCIDDQPQMLQLLGDCLPSFGHRVTIASNGEKGLELFHAAKLKNKPYEIVITDLGLPDVDGHQVAKAIKAESPGTPIIMMTGWGKMMKENKEVPPDVDGLVDKPPNLQKLNDLLCQLTNPARHGRWP